jgi:hypothetical protein
VTSSLPAGARANADSAAPAGPTLTPALLPDRIAEKILPSTPTGCWPWRSANSRRYGIVRWDGRWHAAHRLVYELLVGPIPDGMTLDHTCHPGDGSCPRATCPHRRCVNPAHLEPATNRENILRGSSPSAQAARKTHCPRGHEYTPENTRHDPDGSRRCRTCDNQRRRDKRQRDRDRMTQSRPGLHDG